MNHAQTDVIFISAQKKQNLEELRAWIVRHVSY
jgi:50S ribosomal subunit-associated GTPase HflX